MQRISVADLTLVLEEQPIPIAPTPDLCMCRGRGWVIWQGPAGPEIVPCCCKAREIDARNRKSMLDVSDLGAVQGKTFGNFDASVPGAGRAYNVALAYAEDPQGWLVLAGSVGNGKTHLAAAIANYTADQGRHVLFLVVPDLLGHLRATFSAKAGTSFDELFSSIKLAPLLVLDDLGAEHTTSWGREKIYQLVNYRYNWALPTVFTTNQNGEQLDPRVYSRIMDGQLSALVAVKAGDYRRRGFDKAGKAEVSKE